MTKRKTDEPSKIVMLAPVALVLIIYSFFFHIPQQASLQGLQSRYEKLLSTQHDMEHGLQDTRMAQIQVSRESRGIETELTELTQQEQGLFALRKNLRDEAVRPAWPAATMQQVTSLMERHQLEVLENHPEDGAKDRAEKVIRPFLNLLVDGPQQITNRDAAISMDSREVYKIKVRGKFKDLQSALNSLSRKLDHVLPLSLQMEVLELESTEIRNPERVWTLTILV